MSNMLIEKREELIATRELLIANRQDYIDNKVAAYRAKLEVEVPAANTANIDEAIKAIDTLIAYDKANEQVKEQVIEVVQDKTEDVSVEATEKKEVAEQSAEARPGMSNIFTPTR